MALSVTLSITAITATTVALTALGAGGTGPYTYAFYGSQTNGFTPGAGNKISGAGTGATYTDTGLVQGSTWYFVAIVTDTGNADATANSAQETATTLSVTLTPTTITSTSVALSASAVGGTGPFTYAFYASQTSGFTPGSGNKISGSATGSTITDTGLIQGSTWYFVVIITDTGNSSTTADSAQLTIVTTNSGQQPTQFYPSPVLGESDLFRNSNTIAVCVDPAQLTPFLPGSALKWTTVASNSVPKVVASTATSDLVCGFAYYNTKDTQFSANSVLEMARSGDVIYLIAATTVTRGNFLTSVPPGAGGGTGYVTPTTGSSGFCIVGEALDNATAGQLFRVEVLCGFNLLDNGDVN
jgi:hypothetical protein